MKIFFDVDGTILASDNGAWSLRPGTQDVFKQLANLGHELYVWTATGKPHAETVVETYGLGKWVVACLDKDTNVDPKPDMIVDDDSYLVQKYSGVWVEPYRESDPNDRELLKVIDALPSSGSLNLPA